MSIAGRNDPCPCGSGRKYQRCCWDQDHASAPLRLVPAAAAPGAGRWEVDLVALPIGFEDDRDARPAAVLIVGGHQVLHHDIVSRPPAAADAVAALLSKAIAAAAAAMPLEHRPLRITVRHESIAAALRVYAGDLTVESGRMDQLDDAARSLVDHLVGAPHRHLPASAMAQTWKGWGLPPDTVAGLFAAAADFFRARPWRTFENADLLCLGGRSGTWHVTVMGAGGEVFGLALYERRDDIEGLVDHAAPRDAIGRVNGMMLSLSFDRREDLPPLMRKEILVAGWPVAAPDAYPVLMTLNMPGGGITPEQGADLAVALRGTVAYAALLAKGAWPDGAEPPAWRDAGSGAMLALEVTDAGPGRRDAPSALTLALPTGAGAAPERALLELDPAALARQSSALLHEFEAAVVASRQSAAIARRDRDNAQLLLDYLGGDEISLDAMTEYDLRVFLHDWCLRKVMAPLKTMRSIPVSQKRFLGFVGTRRDLHFPWAEALLDDRGRFEERLQSLPGGFRWDTPVQEWIGEVTLDLAERLLLADDRMADGGLWGETMGPVEWRLHRELQRRWLLWREEAIGAGATDPGDVRRALISRQRQWEGAPHSSMGGETPVAAVERERQRRLIDLRRINAETGDG